MTRIDRRLPSVAGIILAIFCVMLPPAWGQVLFDNTKAETAGNADWIIDTHQPIPSPSITGITSSTSESYWTGALSSWGVALAKLQNSSQISLSGNGLETLPSGGTITYGNSSNARGPFSAFVDSRHLKSTLYLTEASMLAVGPCGPK
jgi:hypothetical protein